jgi:diguanylate cyclase (GGDEF)-like protein
VAYGNQLLDSLKQPFTHENLEFFVTGSIGISIFPDNGEDQDILIKNADIAMYRAKNQGRNNVSLYQPENNSTRNK